MTHSLKSELQLVVLLQREARRRSVLLITTDSEFAESVSERVNVCFDGSVVFSGTVTALVSVLLGEYYKEVMGDHLFSKGQGTSTSKHDLSFINVMM